MRVRVIGAIAPEGVAYLREHGIEVDEVSGTLAKGELYARPGDDDGVITRSSTAVTSELPAQSHTLRILERARVGVDSIDVDAGAHQDRARRGDGGGRTGVDPDFARIVRLEP